jgi:hypothetical protein
LTSKYAVENPRFVTFSIMDISNPSRPKGKRAAPKGKSRSSAIEIHWISLQAKDRTASFGTIKGGAFAANERGRALIACWRALGEGHPSLQSDTLALGPHELRGILFLSPKGSDALNLSEAVRLFKALSANRLARLAKSAARPGSQGSASPGPGSPAGLWKKGYVERSISGKAELAEARKALQTPG